MDRGGADPLCLRVRAGHPRASGAAVPPGALSGHIGRVFARKARWFWPVSATLVLADCSTKELVESVLRSQPGPRAVLGDWLRLTLVFNTGAALNLDLGSWSRIVFSVLASIAIILLFRLYQRTAPNAALRAAALALVAGGALGNLLDRIRSPLGVVDFIDIGVGDTRFWVFNVADVGVTVGAVLLAIVLWQGDRLENVT
ncbi:MAG TPA: signal peptidase II [Gemmatimonadales bacterium]|nr:signal peptidase II [Gemmatimonadales bacterium]